MSEFARRIKEHEGDKYLHMPAAERLELFTAHGQRGDDRLAARGAAQLRRALRYLVPRSHRSSSSGAVEQSLAALEATRCDLSTRKARLAASTKYGDDKDRPLVRSNGKPTYLASDVAYHRE